MPTSRTNNRIYWAATGLLCFGMLLGGLAQLFRVSFNVAGMVHLGYPLYLLSIIGAWKMVGVLALLLPGYPLLKEWTYAGFFFLLTGGVVSHLASGDGLGPALPVLVFAILTVVSWYFRPASRRLPGAAPAGSENV